ncbi:MAG: D-glycero-alpha-D-manno-heptose-1,7-bisphosphate 7-phosphatase [Nitrososphaeria archaeon]
MRDIEGEGGIRKKRFSQKMPAVFLDRDGTINVDCPYCSNPEDVLLYEDALKAIADLSRDHLIIVVTNQSGIGRGYFTSKDLSEVDRRIVEEVERAGGKIDAIYYCPHRPDEGCRCRKPGTGLIEEALSDFEVDLRKSWVVGDDEKDAEMARRAGIRAILLRREGSGESAFKASDMREALKLIRESILNSRAKTL